MSFSHLVVVLLIAVTLVFAPHARGTPEAFKPTMLGGIYWNLLSHLPSRWHAERVVFLGAIAAGLFASCFPIVVAIMLRWHRPGSGRAAAVVLIAGALLACIGALANTLLILLNQTTFAFGGRPVPGGVVAFAVTVALVQGLAAVAGFALAFSSRFAALAT